MMMGFRGDLRSFGLLGMLMLSFVFVGVVIGASAPGSLDLRLVSNWPATSLVAETSEFFGEISSSSFWTFVDAIAARGEVLKLSDKALYEALISEGENLLSKLQMGLLRLALRLRYHSPTVAMHERFSSETKTVLKEQPEYQKWCEGSNEEAWVYVNGLIACSPSEVESALQKTAYTSDHEAIFGRFPSEHIYNPQLEGVAGVPTALLFAPLGTASFVEFHQELKRLAAEDKLVYVYRHARSRLAGDEPMELQGYGVELALKNTEYKAVDDSNVKRKQATGEEDSRYAEEEWENLSLAEDLLQVVDEQQNSEWAKQDLTQLGLLASQQVLESDKAVTLLKDLSQNFPNVARLLAEEELDNDLVESIIANGNNGGQNIVIINGKAMEASSVDISSLYDSVRKEIYKFETLRSLSLDSASVLQLLSGDSGHDEEDELMETDDESKNEPIRFDVRTPVTLFVNDLEKDKKYANWPSSLKLLNSPMMPGQLRNIKRNIITSIVVLNPGITAGLETMAFIYQYLWRNLPQRVGFVLTSELPFDDEGEVGTLDERSQYAVACVKLFKYLHSQGDQAPIQFFFRFIQEMAEPSLDELAAVFFRVYRKDLFEAINDPSLLEFVDASNAYVREHFTSSPSDLPMLFVNGLKYEGSNVVEGLIHTSYSEYTYLTNLYRKGAITDETPDIFEYLMTLPTTSPSYNPIIVTSKANPAAFIQLTMDVNGEPLSSEEDFLNKLPFFSIEEHEDSVKPISHILITDLASKEGAALGLAAIDSLRIATIPARVAFIDNANTDESFIMMRAIHAASKQRSSKSLGVVRELLRTVAETEDEDFTVDSAFVLKIAQESPTLNVEKFTKRFEGISEKLEKQQELERGLVSSISASYPDPHHAILTNGRLIVLPFDSPALFRSNDFALLTTYEYNSRAKKLRSLLDRAEFEDVHPDDLTSDFRSTVLMKVSSLLSKEQSSGAYFPRHWRSQVNENKRSLAVMQVDLLINPLSKAAQKFSAIFEALLQHFPINYRIFLNPTMEKQETVPLKTFYRFVLRDFVFDEDGKLVPVPTLFENLPKKPLLTLGLDTPESWFTEPIVAEDDLDNIRLADTAAGRVEATFVLEHLLVSGQCIDLTNPNNPPRGLQLVLSTATQPHYQDTLVMANLAYFQLKANPGVFYLSLAEGRASELYDLVSANGIPVRAVNKKEVPIYTSSFAGSFVSLKVQKKPGKEKEQLLVADAMKENAGQSDDDIWNSLSGIWKAPNKEVAAGEEGKEPETVHIFSIASGHLYERFLKIMMLSVVKNTKAPVKFWFLKNFLSPKFKDFIPSMAKQFGFQYELVTYQWPSWLNKQTEKQRIIWAYKCLFLDVLFPLNLTKVIFVDADQVVRTDMKELWDMDLDGAPLAYTPFCSSRTEMDGFRFWKQGFWADHLRGRPYHISALYVVDLVRFRQLAAGDIMRSTYEMLSRDPNSLANLDQDLPNYLQHQIRIFSLPQEWLWCETWCDDESKPKAKTIDLCNNPLTKTPKLENAVRIVPEWTTLDNTVKEFERQLELSKQTSASASTSTHPAHLPTLSPQLEIQL